MPTEDRLPPDAMPFGDALGELETIVGQLESGQLELEDSLEKYERGVALLRALQARLSEAQHKVTVLMGELEADAETPESGGRDE